MLNALLLVSLAHFAPVAAAPTAAVNAAAQEVDVRASFVELHAKNDEAGCEKLFRTHPGDVLGTIDADLEGSLATWEKAPEKPDEAAIAAQHSRALWGARIASRVSSNPIFLDYTSAFVGWTPEQKKNFRGGQGAHGRSRRALKAKDYAAAAAAARECIELAAPLGDWWGHAMGLAALGQTLATEGKHNEALAPLAEAALIYRQLQFSRDELGLQRTLGASLVALGAKQRALAALERALVLSEQLGDAKGVEALKAQLDPLRADLSGKR
jgi:tetratricopeptide (TPR) repeat protein